MTDEATPTTVRRRGRRIKGIVAAAAALGVTRGHLWSVLHGRRQSQLLMRRYWAFLGGNRADNRGRRPPIPSTERSA